MSQMLDKLTRRQRDAVRTVQTALAGQNRLFAMLDAWLLDDEQKQVLGLNPWNIYFLNMAAHFFEAGKEAATKEGMAAAGIEDEKQAELLAGICRRAAGRTDGTDIPYDRDLIFGDLPVNTALLAGAIELGAALDLERPETVRRMLGRTGDRDSDTRDIVKADFSVVRAGPHPHQPGTIRLKIRCRSPRVHTALKHHETKVLKRLHMLNARVSPRFLFSELSFEIEPEGYLPYDMKFSVDSTAALHLFTGNRLYSDKRVFLRELVQNAVDACNLRKIFDPRFDPQISIEIDGDEPVVRFRDNGIGMDRQWIEKYFLKIGISFYQSGDLQHMSRRRLDFNFISKFGIGFLSSFLVSDRIVIQTRKKGYEGLIITIENLQDYFNVIPAPGDCPTGTTVSLYLSETKNRFSQCMAYQTYLKTNLRYLSVPVSLTDHQGNHTLLGRETLRYETDAYYACEFVSRLGFKDAEAYLFMKAKQDGETLYGLERAAGGISIFQDGIFVTQTADLLPEGARQSIIGRINLCGADRCELSMDRNRVFWTETQLRHIKKQVRSGIVDLANQILNSEKYRVSQSLINQLSIFFDFNEIDDELYDRLGEPVRRIVAKRFRDFVRIEFAHTGDQRHVPEAEGYSENWQRRVLEGFQRKSRPPVAGTGA